MEVYDFSERIIIHIVMTNTDIHIYSVLCPQFLEVLYYYQIYPENH